MSEDDPTFEQVAQWMVNELNKQDYLDQQTAAFEISSRFGEQFTYTNDNGNLAINIDVLTAFKKLTSNSIVWERGTRTWRKRMDYDKPGREQ
jgi:hypothetical protein